MSRSDKSLISEQHACGFNCWHPKCIQKYANYRTFMAVYGLLGTIQAMAYMYFLVTLTTIEKRFKIPSQTMGIVLSGNEISQIMLSLILSYVGGQRNRPRWIAWGCVFCGISCYILALPHFIYGAGEDALKLTKEYWSELNRHDNSTATSSLLLVNMSSSTKSESLCGAEKEVEKCEPYLSLLPLILIFVSQFVLGIGNTLYYSLGQTYLDDNTKKNNTPLLMALAMSLRMIGPIVGFPLGYFSLNMFIDPGKTPLITNKDPRWLGAWWVGWMVLGTLLLVFSGLLGLFPKTLPKTESKDAEKRNSHLPHVLRIEDLQLNEGLPLGSSFNSNTALDAVPPGAGTEFPTLKDFPKALVRLLRNKLLIYNIVSTTFYILGAGGYMTFMTKYMEVQFHQTSQNGTIVAGPISILGMVIGTLGSGIVISRYKPGASKVLMWNVIVGFIGIMGQISYMFIYCPDSVSVIAHGSGDFNTACNANCSCADQAYSPVCHLATDTTFYSPCHAGCRNWDEENKRFYNCSCLAYNNYTTKTINSNIANFQKLQNLPESLKRDTSYINDFTDTEEPLYASIPDSENFIEPGICMVGCTAAFTAFFTTALVINFIGSSGRIGNLLVNYRSVDVKDKSFAQGLLLMMISLFALIPGPIIFGRLIDSTCLVWTETCNGKGNCQLYDQATLRYLMNGGAAMFTSLGVFFDFMVWKHGRNLDLYGDKETQHAEEMKKHNKVIAPLLANQ